MKVLDPGHLYKLDTLDGDGEKETIRFVKREGQMYPGNVGAYPGTNLQEVLRACCDRLSYVNEQIPDANTLAALKFCQMAIWSLEQRAAARHGRELQASPVGIEFRPTCKLCGHVECNETCRKEPPATGQKDGR